MDYDALAQLLPLPTGSWNQFHVQQWLQFVHLDNLIPSFSTQEPIQA